MKINVRVPMLSDSVASGTLLPWRKQVGEKVARDETLVDLETDKVILEIPSPASGTLVAISQPEGAVVKAEEVVAVIETGEAAVSSIQEPPEQVAQVKPTVEPRTTPSPLVGEGANVMPKTMAAPPPDGTSSHSTKSASGQVAG